MDKHEQIDKNIEDEAQQEVGNGWLTITLSAPVVSANLAKRIAAEYRRADERIVELEERVGLLAAQRDNAARALTPNTQLTGPKGPVERRVSS